MSEVITIKGRIREATGKGAARKLRSTGFIPANIIGGKSGSSVMLELEAKDLSKAWQNNKQFNLDLDGETKLVKIQELQLHAARREALHADLMYI